MVEGRHPEVRNTEGSDGRPDEAPPDALRISAPAVPSTVPEARRLLVAFAARHGAGETVLRDVALAVTEAVTNVVVHAYEPSDVAGGVDVIADIKDGALEVLVVDHGLGFRSGRSDGLGLGLATIAAATARFSIAKGDAGGTEVWMRFELQP